MAIQEFDGVFFEGLLGVSLGCCPGRCDVLPGPAHRATWPHNYRFGTTGGAVDRLKIDAPQITFDCKVKASGKENVGDWETGILQSISCASWVAYYSNGAELRYRLKLDNSFIRDSESADCLFFQAGRSLPATPRQNGFERQFQNCDGPGVTFVTGFSGDPFQPHTPKEDGLELLVRTEGQVNFHSFLAVVNKKTGVILTLGESHWQLTWDGTYDPTSRTWSPVASDSIIVHTETDIARTYENPRDSAVSLPFSIDPPIANDRKEILTPDGWMTCREGLPDLGDRQRTC
jgi:hypothetical protein